MKNCPDFEDRVNDYLDDALAPPERAALERHLEGCAGCREFLAALRSLREKTAALPRSVEPARDLWPDIRGSFASAGRGRGRLMPVFRVETAARRRVGVVAAAAGIVLVAMAGAWMALRPARAPAGRAPSAGLSTRSALPLLDAGYRSPTRQLREALREGGAEGSSSAVKVIEENLRIVEGAIDEMRRAAEIDSLHGVDDRLCTSLYRTRFELLRQAVRLSTQEGEEKSS